MLIIDWIYYYLLVDWLTLLIITRFNRRAKEPLFDKLLDNPSPTHYPAQPLNKGPEHSLQLPQEQKVEEYSKNFGYSVKNVLRTAPSYSMGH